MITRIRPIHSRFDAAGRGWCDAAAAGLGATGAGVGMTGICPPMAFLARPVNCMATMATTTRVAPRPWIGLRVSPRSRKAKRIAQTGEELSITAARRAPIMGMAAKRLIVATPNRTPEAASAAQPMRSVGQTSGPNAAATTVIVMAVPRIM